MSLNWFWNKLYAYFATYYQEAFTANPTKTK